MTSLAHKFVSNKGRTQTEANAAAKAAQKKWKKFKKKLATAVGIRLDRALGDKWASQAFKKNEKKACQASKSFINAPKPNQTNGETND